MGLFSKKMQCERCGMELVGQSCSYCGFVDKNQPSRQTNKIETIHSNHDGHIIDSQTKKIEDLKTYFEKLNQRKQSHPKKMGKAVQTLLSLFFILAGLMWVGTIQYVMQSFQMESGEVPKFGNEITIWISAIVFFMMLFSQGSIIRKILTMTALCYTSFILFIKPFVAPVKIEYQEGFKNFSLTSETHLYFFIPAVILSIFAVVFILNLLLKFVRLIIRV